jgi:hypothetical protein
VKRAYDAGCDIAGWALAAGAWSTAMATLPAGLAMAVGAKVLTLPCRRVS